MRVNKKFIIMPTFLVGLLLLISCGGSGSKDYIPINPQLSKAQKNVPDYITQNCGACHGIVIGDERVTSGPTGWDVKLLDGKTWDGWEKTVMKMIKENGCNVPGGIGGETYNKIVSWFAENYGPNTVSAKALPSDPAQLVQLACGPCHNLSINGNPVTTTSPLNGPINLLDGKSQWEWEFVVCRMINKNGCAIPGGARYHINTGAGQTPTLVDADCLKIRDEGLYGIKASNVDCTWVANNPGQATIFEKIVCYLTQNYGPGCANCGTKPTVDLSAPNAGQLIAQNTCTICHGIIVGKNKVKATDAQTLWDVIVIGKKTKKGWERTIRRMIYANGAQLPTLTDLNNSCGCPSGDTKCLENCAIDRLATYLDTNFGSGSTNIQEYALSDFASVKEAIEITCGQCHGITVGIDASNVNNVKKLNRATAMPIGRDMALLQGKTQQEWERTIDRMIDVEGCTLPLDPSDPRGVAKSAFAQWLAQNYGTNKTSQNLPQDGAFLTQWACNTCHGIIAGGLEPDGTPTQSSVVVTRHPYQHAFELLTGKTNSGWYATVDRMINTEGCQIPGGLQGQFATAIIDYLTTNVSDTAVTTNVNNWTGLTTQLDRGRALVQRACSVCHGITIINQGSGPDCVITQNKHNLQMVLMDGKTDSGWQFTVNRMIQMNGCAVPNGTTGQEYQDIIAYLSTNWGPGSCNCNAGDPNCPPQP